MLTNCETQFVQRLGIILIASEIVDELFPSSFTVHTSAGLETHGIKVKFLPKFVPRCYSFFSLLSAWRSVRPRIGKKKVNDIKNTVPMYLSNLDGSDQI